jgi:hypothetical protein
MNEIKEVLFFSLLNWLLSVLGFFMFMFADGYNPQAFILGVIFVSVGLLGLKVHSALKSLEIRIKNLENGIEQIRLNP